MTPSTVEGENPQKGQHLNRGDAPKKGKGLFLLLTATTRGRGLLKESSQERGKRKNQRLSQG